MAKHALFSIILSAVFFAGCGGGDAAPSSTDAARERGLLPLADFTKAEGYRDLTGRNPDLRIPVESDALLLPPSPGEEGPSTGLRYARALVSDLDPERFRAEVRFTVPESLPARSDLLVLGSYGQGWLNVHLWSDGSLGYAVDGEFRFTPGFSPLEPGGVHLVGVSLADGDLCLSLDDQTLCETLAERNLNDQGQAPYDATAGFAWNADGLALDGWVERLTLYGQK